MSFFKRSIIACFVMCLFSGCASIVSKSNWPFAIDSNPSGASVSIKNKKGFEVFRGRTPTALKLKSGAGFFAKESYTITLIMDGYETKTVNVECKINGWYFGNILIGGLLGLLIIDPATGAMYKLETNGVTANLDRSSGDAVSLKILDKNQLTEAQKKHLVKIN